MSATVTHLAQTATQLAARIRDENPDDNATWLAQQLPDPGDWFRLSFVLAAAIPDDRTWTQLTAWTSRPLPPKPAEPAEPTHPASRGGRGQRRSVKPCGTLAAISRHRYRAEPLCAPCSATQRVYEREKSARRRAAKRELAA
jgi:hypothetical protein